MMKHVPKFEETVEFPTCIVYWSIAVRLKRKGRLSWTTCLVYYCWKAMTAGGFCALGRSYPLRPRRSRSKPSSFVRSFAISKQRAQRRAHSSSCVGLFGTMRKHVICQALAIESKSSHEGVSHGIGIQERLIVRLLTGQHSSWKRKNTHFLDEI
jgi:hypothetical protein